MVCYKIHSLESGLSMLRKRDQGYQTLEVFGPEHEYSIIDEQLQPMPIVDQIIKKMSGKVTNTVEFSDFASSDWVNLCELFLNHSLNFVLYYHLGELIVSFFFSSFDYD